MNTNSEPWPQGPAFEFKKIMAARLEDYLEEHPEESKKTVAAKLEGASSADLSHWLFKNTGYTMPGHLVPVFCRIVGENSLFWHLQDQYEKGRVA